VRAEDLNAAFASERLRRGLSTVDQLTVPDEGMWRVGYQKVARDAPGVPEKMLAAALPLAKRFVDPVLAGADKGTWDPVATVWREH
jgi:hypothetical protein